MSDAANQVLKRSVEFLEGELNTRNMVFSIPAGQTFKATSLTMLPYFRRVSIDRSSAGPSDEVFSPGVWAHDILQFTSDAFVQCAVDVMWKLSETKNGVTREYQNSPCSAAATFSGNHVGWWLTYTSVYPGSLVFDVPWELPGGSALSLQVTPTYTGICPTTGRKNQFQIIAMLHGLREY
jgi:hypothetical protein